MHPVANCSGFQHGNGAHYLSRNILCYSCCTDWVIIHWCSLKRMSNERLRFNGYASQGQGRFSKSGYYRSTSARDHLSMRRLLYVISGDLLAGDKGRFTPAHFVGGASIDLSEESRCGNPSLDVSHFYLLSTPPSPPPPPPAPSLSLSLSLPIGVSLSCSG